MSAVTHPSFISYYDSFLDNGCLYIVMELAQRGDLSQLLTAHKPQSVRNAVQRGRDVASSLQVLTRFLVVCASVL